MLTGDIAIWQVCAATRIYAHPCWLLSSWYITDDICGMFKFRDGVSGKNTQFPRLPTGLHQKGQLAVNLSASIKSCKISNSAM